MIPNMKILYTSYLGAMDIEGKTAQQLQPWTRLHRRLDRETFPIREDVLDQREAPYFENHGSADTKEAHE